MFYLKYLSPFVFCFYVVHCFQSMFYFETDIKRKGQ